MNEIIRLIMDETGCDEGQADLALISAGYDAAHAIRRIRALLRGIFVVKAKFHCPGPPLYGLVSLIANTQQRTLIRAAALAGYNPAVYEMGLDRPWYLFERDVYSARILEGTSPELTHQIAHALHIALEGQPGEEVYDALKNGEHAPVHDALMSAIEAGVGGEPAVVAFVLDELSLGQFRALRERADDDFPGGEEGSHEKSPLDPLPLEVDLVKDENGIPADRLDKGDVILTLITDERDIAQYLSRLLGGRNGSEFVPLTARVEQIDRAPDIIVLTLWFGPGVIGTCRAQPDLKVRVVRRARGSGWLKRLLGGAG